MSREWPEKGTVSLDALVGPLREAQRRMRKGESAEYDGLGIPSLLYVSQDIDETLSPESLEYLDERGSDADTVVLGCAVQLGMEQGIRYHKGEQERLWDLLRAVNACLHAGDRRSLDLAREAMGSVMAFKEAE